MSIGESTILYLIVFLITCYCTNQADKKFSSNNKRLAVFLSVIAIFVPTLLAGVRADTVGKDVLEYAVRTFDSAQASSSLKQLKSISGEPVGYLTLAFFTSRLFHNCGYFLFTSQLLVIVPIYIVAYKRRESAPMWLTMSCYLFLFYNNSFNTMKQFVSCSFILLLYCLLEEKKYIKAALCFVVAFSFHFSAVMGLAFILLAKLIKRKNARSTRVVLAAVCLLFAVYLKSISHLLVEYSLLPERYVRNVEAVFGSDMSVYLKLTGFNSHVFLEWMFKVSFIALPIAFLKKAERDIDENIKIITLLGVVFYTYVLVAFQTVYGGRISIFCDFFMIMLIPMLKNVFKQDKFEERVAVNSVIVSYIALYWFIFIMIYGVSASNHFRFRF